MWQRQEGAMREVLFNLPLLRIFLGRFFHASLVLPRFRDECNRKETNYSLSHHHREEIKVGAYL